MTENQPCPAVDAPDAAPPSSDTLPSPSSEPLPSLVEAVFSLAQAIEHQASAYGELSAHLAQIVEQNADLIELLTDEDGDEESEVDLSGKPLR